MEVLPKPTFHGRVEELAFYNALLRTAAHVVPFDIVQLEQALVHACRFGLSAFDAMHAVAAEAAGCHELVTSEPTSPLFRLRSVRVVSMHSL